MENNTAMFYEYNKYRILIRTGIRELGRILKIFYNTINVLNRVYGI